jgi:hypothetical protein
LRKVGNRARTIQGFPMTPAASQYLVWILPRWRDPLFVWRCVSFGVALSVMLLLSLGFAEPALGWLILLLSVWPYRAALTVHEECIRIRWLIFRSTISTKGLLQIKLESTALGFHLLTLCRHDAPQLVLQGSRSQLAALRTALFSKLEYDDRPLL